MADLVFTALVDAQSLATRVDNGLGYPRNGTNAATGRSVVSGVGRTERFSAIRKHPSRSEWAYPDTATVRTYATAQEITRSQTLDGTWATATDV